MAMKDRIRAGEQLVVFGVGRMFHHNIVRYLGMSGDFDGFWLDLEHGGFTTHEIETAVAAGTAHGLSSACHPPTTPL